MYKFRDEKGQLKGLQSNHPEGLASSTEENVKEEEILSDEETKFD